MADWKDHKVSCARLRTRKTIYRTGGLLQDIFYMYRENVFDTLIVKIEIQDEKMYIHAGEDSGQLVNSHDVLEPFPNDLVKDIRDKQAILAHGACGDVLAWMHDIIKYLLAGKSRCRLRLPERFADAQFRYCS